MILSRAGIAAAVFALIIGAFFLGVVAGYENRPEVDKVTSLINKQDSNILNDATQKVDFAPFWKAWNLINEKYVPTTATTTTATDTQDRVYGAITGMVAALGDPYTVFMPPQESKQFNQTIQGSFGGVGMEVGMKNGVITVIAPLKGSPAEKAGIKTGDAILKIDGKSTENMDVDSAINLIRGLIGTSVKLSLLPKGKNTVRDIKEITIVRREIVVPITDAKLRDDGIFVISLYNFDEQSADQFRASLKQFINSGSNKLVLDLRGNPGGYLEAAVDIASWFLPEGKLIVTEDYGPKEQSDIFRSRGYDAFTARPIHLAILVDGGSASAAEILAGALAQNNIAKLVGEKTFGKGSVQELVPVTDSSQLKITVARWLTPNGTSISKSGLMPDYTVSLTDDDIAKHNDAQLNKAVELLKNGTI